MKESASSIFNGIGKIEHGATKSNAEQESRVLMLSENIHGFLAPVVKELPIEGVKKQLVDVIERKVK
ncbi:FeS assembly protein SufD [Mycobacteroides abscessus subsp. abscessus]|nr:FeS assembly protein SufD [Mycobacteroides abscessus subsp. abscessus]